MKRSRFVLGAGYFWYFAVTGTFLPFWPVYLQHRGYGATAIGALLATFYVSRVFGPPAYAAVADRTGRRVLLLRFALVVSAVCAASFGRADGVAQMALALGLFSAMFNGVVALYDAQVLDDLGAEAGRYGRLRLWGSLGFAVASLCGGPMFARAGIAVLPLVLVLLLVATLACYLGLEERAATRHRDDVALGPLLANRRVLAFLVVCFLMLASHGPYYGFLSLYLLRNGHAQTFVGAMWAWAVVCEVLVFLAAPWLLARLAPRPLVLVALAATAVRWSLLAAWPRQTVVVVLAQALHLASFGMFHLWSVSTAKSLFPSAAASRAQALHGAVGYGLGGAVGAFGSGLLWDQCGPRAPYLVAAFIVIFAFLVAAAGTGPSPSDEPPVRSGSR